MMCKVYLDVIEYLIIFSENPDGVLLQQLKQNDEMEFYGLGGFLL